MVTRREQCFVTSDLHLGNGIGGDPLEDFWQDQAFSSWVGEMGEGTTLVLNGDVIECAQLAPFAMPGVPSFLAWDQAASVTKVGTAIDGHPRFFDALAGLVERGGTVVFTIGNHDLDLAFPQVQQLLRRRLGVAEVADPITGPVQLYVGAYRYQGVHIEHGHEFSPENCPRDPASFLHAFDDGSGAGERLFLERVWGTDLVLRVFNHIERRYPFADNVKPSRSILWQGLRRGWLSGADAVSLAAFLATRRVPMLSILRSWVLEAEDQAALAQGDAVATLIATFQDPTWSDLFEELEAEEAFSAQVESGFASLDPTIRQLLVDAPPVTEVDDLTIGGVTAAGTPAGPGATLGPFGRREERSAKRVLDRGASHVVFGHTHHQVDGELGGKAFNPGTWIPRLNLDDPHVTRHIEEVGLTAEVLSDPSLYNFKLRAVHIQPGADPMVRLVTISHDPDVPVVGVGRLQP